MTPKTPAHEAAEMSLEAVRSVLAGQRFQITTENRLQAGIYQALVDLGYDAEREFVLAKGSRVDIFIPSLGLGIECKVKGSKRGMIRQVERYCEQESIQALILASTTMVPLPKTICGKPVRLVNLSRAWL